MIEPRVLVAYCDRLLDAERFSDYAPNGLQVEGERPISRLICGVTASAALIEAAVSQDADAILVHHGWFWKNENPCLVGIKGRRARILLRAGISLIAYHLPLDAHPEMGNNATLASHLGFVDAEPTAVANGLIWLGCLPKPLDADEFADHLCNRLGRPAIMVGRPPERIKRVAWCTGGGQGYIEDAAALGIDAFVSGELSEQTTHQARELGIGYFAAGHHATERYGVQALGAHLAAHFRLWQRFVEIDNPA